MDRLDKIFIWHIVTLAKMKLAKKEAKEKWN
jgi:hypothetical protein